MLLLRKLIQRLTPVPFDWRKLFQLFLCFGCLFLRGTVEAGQPTTPVTLTVLLRYADGTAVIDEPVTLEQPLEADFLLPVCTTDAAGRCVWQVTRGLYQLQFNRPLDVVSGLALAEGGLSGLGITVGDAPIAYHFTFHSDGRVYFDAAPEAAMPSPIIPVGDLLHGGTAPVATATPEHSIALTAAPLPDSDYQQEDGRIAVLGLPWHLLLYLGGGIAIGIGLHVWTQKRQQGGSRPEPFAHKETGHD